MEKQTAVRQLLSLIPDAAEIKAFISENDADEKMLDEWLWERIYKGKDWEALEKQQIVDAYIAGDGSDIETETYKMLLKGDAEQYFESTYKTKEG